MKPYEKAPKGIGAVLKGWHNGSASVADFRAMTEACPHNCPHCFTDKQKKTLTLNEIKEIIDQIADLGFTAIDYPGEGEPTLDRDFFSIIEYTASKKIQPVIFTDVATRMRDRTFVRRVKETGASVVSKCDSLWNPEYQNWIVGDRTNKYFDQRKHALELLIEEEFNKVEEDGTTRLGFDMVMSQRNKEEAERTLRYCRENNLWVIFTFHLPAGRSGREDFDKSLVLGIEERTKIQNTVMCIDAEYGFVHPVFNNFVTSPCVEFVCIYGDGRVAPCVGNENIVGNLRSDSLKSLIEKIKERYSCHRPENYTGNCPYRN